MSEFYKVSYRIILRELKCKIFKLNIWSSDYKVSGNELNNYLYHLLSYIESLEKRIEELENKLVK